MTAKFYFVPPRPTEQQIELAFWASVKDSTSPAVLRTYLERYPSGEFAPIARTLIEHYDQQLKLELAAREEERKRLEETMKAAEAKRLEDEQRSREAALTTERKRAEETRNSGESARLEKERAELLVRNDELRKALDEARVARDAAREAERQRLKAVEAAESAKRAAEEAIAKRQDAEKTKDGARVAALPKVEVPTTSEATWTVSWVRGPGCGQGGGGSYRRAIRVSASGTASWTQPAVTDGAPIRYQGTFRGNAGSGSFARHDGRCSGTFTARRG
jgi:hypothetical protein